MLSLTFRCQTLKPAKDYCTVFFPKASDSTQGQVVRKPVNANPGLKVNQSNYFSCIKMFSTYVLCGLRLLKLKTEGQTL